MTQRKIPIDDLAKNNPKVNIEQFREAEAQLDELRKQGVVKHRYALATPYGSRPSRARKSERESTPKLSR